MLKLVSTPDFIHQYQVVRDDGLPDITLSLFASELMKSLSPGSVPVYMREVLALFNWALSDSTVQRHQWKMLGPVVEARNIIREYLTVAAKCKLTYRADRSGVKATYVSETQETRINVRILLAALRRFYDHLISSKIYEPPNPLLHAEMGRVTQELRAQYRRAVREIEGRDPMPAVSGVDPPSGIRLSANFFRCVDREWVPKTIDDPDFPHLVYKAGKEYGWGLRELCVVRILFEGGGRISEVLDLTALDWKANCSGTRRARSPEPCYKERADSKLPTEARYFWMRSATLAWSFSRNCCGLCKSRSSNVWEAHGRSRSMCG